MSNHRYKTWTQAAELPETSVRMDRLPDGLNFPDDFPEPIRFDSQRKRLVYRGLMFTPSYQFLRGLSNDTGYTTTVDVLYQQTANAASGGATGIRLWLWLAFAAIGGLAGGTAWLWLR